MDCITAGLHVSSFPPQVFTRSCDAYHVAQEATGAEAELLRVHLTEAGGRVVGKSLNFCLF